MQGELLEADRVHSIVGGFFAVYNYYGYGLSERVYTGALARELCDRGHIVIRELVVDVRYKGRHVAGQRLDMVIDDRVVVEKQSRGKTVVC
jgi:GxxExxY protein